MIIPNMLTSTNGREYQSDLYSTLLDKKRVIHVGEINEESARLICSELIYLNNQSHEPIYMIIDGPGGVVSAGLGILDVMKSIKSEVVTVCLGIAASMDAVILSSGTKGKRYISKHSEVMIHQPSGGAQGQTTDIEIISQHAKWCKATLIGIMSECTGKTSEELEKDMDRDFYMSAEKAVEYGIADIIGLPSALLEVLE